MITPPAHDPSLQIAADAQPDADYADFRMRLSGAPNRLREHAYSSLLQGYLSDYDVGYDIKQGKYTPDG
jgi:hypothetical protein